MYIYTAGIFCMQVLINAGSNHQSGKVVLTQHFFKRNTAPTQTTATNHMTTTHNTLNPVPFMVSHNSVSQM